MVGAIVLYVLLAAAAVPHSAFAAEHCNAQMKTGPYKIKNLDITPPKETLQRTWKSPSWRRTTTKT